MNSITKMNWNDAIASAQNKFNESELVFSEEQTFAAQLMQNNDYLLKVAKNNPISLKLAMYNVAAIGLSLNPSLGLAYLVPRVLKRGEPAKICVDLSYRGLISLAVESGSILWAKACLVHEHDEFLFHGVNQTPTHNFNPFSTDRGDIVGVYCLTQLTNNCFQVETMSIAELNKVRDRSEAYKNGFGPWIDWLDQMYLKTVCKRASKWWPKVSNRFAHALRVLNEENGEGINFNNQVQPANEPVSLPPPPTDLEVSEDVRGLVQSLCDRIAAGKTTTQACREWVKTRFKQPELISYAFHKLDISENVNASKVIN